MTTANTPEPESPKPTQPDEKAGKADFYAIGCGCLVTLLFFAAVVWAGMTRQ